MINIVRPLQSPTSLQRQAVKDYLDELADWKVDYANQLVAYQLNPTLPQPNCKFESTKKPNYRNSDLMEAFDEHFFSKCYLTEEKFQSSYEMDVEHFLPKSEYPELKYEWSNLYPADHDANMLKPTSIPADGYLDPCDSNDDVEHEIIYDFSFGRDRCYFSARNLTNQKAVNTALLLDRIHNGHDRESKIKTRGLRFAVFKYRNQLTDLVVGWQDAIIRQDEQDTFRYSNQIREMVSRTSDFTMLLRSTKAARFLPNDFFD